MSQWLGWKKLILVFIVCVGHLTLLVGFSHSLASGKPSRIDTNSNQNLLVTLRPTITVPLTDALAKPLEPTSKVDIQEADVASTASNQKIATSGSLYSPGLLTRDYFFDAGSVDQSAAPGDDFEALLSQHLPLNIQTVILEFWIENDGRTVDVKCLEGACTYDVIASLPKLAELVFKPAIKNGEAVANRKVIQIDPKPSPGL